jgi:asparagine synthase (glutamine-hydrolysing)
MSGISGIWNTDGKPVQTELLKSISAQLAHRGIDGEYLSVSGPVGLSCQLMRNAPESAAEVQPWLDKGCVVVFDGRLDDRDELMAKLGDRSFDSETPAPVLVAAAYRKWGEDFPLRLNGDFAIALFDEPRQQLLLLRDAVGPRPLYYCDAGGTVIFASEITAILHHPDAPHEPNIEALAGYLIGAQGVEKGVTFFKNIYRVVPGHITVISRNTLVTRKYWDFDPAARVRFKRVEEYAEGLRHQFERAVKRRTRTSYPSGVFVSGGLDSSAIFCVSEEIRRRGESPSPATFSVCQSGPAGTPADEIEFVKHLERYTAASVVRVERSPVQSLEQSLAKIRKTEVPDIELIARYNDAMAEVLKSKGARTVLTGHWGDQMLSNQTYLVDLAYRMRWWTVRRDLREYPRWLTETDAAVFPRTFRLELVSDLVTAHWPKPFINILGRIRSKATLKRRDCAWYTDEFRTQALRYGATHDLQWRKFRSASARSYYKNLRAPAWLLAQEYNNKWLSHWGLDAAFPFLDRELIAFSLAIPAGMHFLNGVPKGLFRKAMTGLLPPEIQHRTSKGDLTELMNESMRLCFDQFVGLLENSTIAQDMGLVDSKNLRAELLAVKTKLRGDSVAAWQLQGVAGLEHWLHTFFAGRFSQASTNRK